MHHVRYSILVVRFYYVTSAIVLNPLWLCACGPSDAPVVPSAAGPQMNSGGGGPGSGGVQPATAGGDPAGGASSPRDPGGPGGLAAGAAMGAGGAAPAPAGTSGVPDAGGAGVSPADPSSFDWAAGDYPPELHEQTYLELSDVPGQSGKVRGYKVHVPARYDPAVPAAVLFALHGYQQNAVMFVVDGTGFVAKSDEEGFILVMPNGVQEDLIGGSWNAGICCGAAAAQDLDDVGLMRAIYAELRTHLNIDEARVYATGLSNGGFMAHRLGCDAADLFTAIAPLAGTIGTSELGAIGTDAAPDFASCEPSRPVAVLYMHGNGDPIVPYAGMKPTLDRWADRNGCAAVTGDAAVPESGGDTTCITYEGCPEGIEVTGCTVQDGGHCWFGDEGCGTGVPGLGNLFVGNDSNFLVATDAAWDFLGRFAR